MLLETKALHRAVQNSLVVGLITAVISTILGTCGRARNDTFRVSVQAGHRRLHHATRWAAARDHRGGRAAGIADAIGLSAFDLVGDRGARVDLRPVLRGHSQFSLSGPRQEPGRSVNGSGRNRLGDILADHFPPYSAGRDLQSADNFHPFPSMSSSSPFFLTGTEVTLPVYIWSQLRFPAKLPSVMALGHNPAGDVGAAAYSR